MSVRFPGFVVLFTMTVLLVACGFHLRRPPDLPAQMRAIYISGGGSVLERSLRRDLETGSSRVVEDATQATALLKIMQVHKYSSLLAISSTGVPLEYKVVYEAEFSLLVGNTTLMEPQTLVLSRTYNYNISDAIGNQEQEQGLYSTMAVDMAQLITFRIEAAAKAALQPPVTPAPAPVTGQPKG